MYAVVAFFNPATTLNALAYFFVMLVKVLPVLVLVFIVLFLTNAFVSPARIRKHLGEDSGLKGWFYAVISDMVLSGPPYVLYPFLGELKRQGARNALIATMLYNRNVKIHFVPAIVYYFGIPYTIVLSVYIILFSLVNGKILEFFVDEQSLA